MARRRHIPTESTSASKEPPSNMEPQGLASSVIQIPGLGAIAATNTHTTMTPSMAYTLPKTDAQELQMGLSKEDHKSSDHSSPKSRSFTTSNSEKLSLVLQSAPNHELSTPTIPSNNAADHKDNKIESAKTVILQSRIPEKHSSINGTNGGEIASSSKPGVANSEPSRVNLIDNGKDLTNQPKKHSSKLQPSNRDSNGSQGSKEGNTKENITLNSAPRRKFPVIDSTASRPSQTQAPMRSPTATTLLIPKQPVPEKPATRPFVRDWTPLSAPYTHMRNDWELQHYRPSTNKDQVASIHEPRGSSKWPDPRGSQPPARNHFQHYPRDLGSELDALAYQHRDLHDWLSFTGWHDHDYRLGLLHRKRRLADLDREKNEIDKERAELLSADERALKKPTRFRDGFGGMDDFEIDYTSRNAGRELFISPLMRSRKREYNRSDCGADFPRKMSRVDGRADRRDSSPRARDGHSKRGYYHEEVEEGEIIEPLDRQCGSVLIGSAQLTRSLQTGDPRRIRRPSSPTCHVAHRVQHSPERGRHHSSLNNGLRRRSSSRFPPAGGYRDEKPGPFSSARLENPRSPPPRGGRGGRGSRGGHRPSRRGA